MDEQFARDFADRWAAEWNAHDLDALLAHFAENVVWTSPVAVKLISGSDGKLRGKAALRDYYAAGINHIPDLHHEVIGVYRGVDTIVINFRNQAGGIVNEVMRFEGELIVEGHGTYLME